MTRNSNGTFKSGFSGNPNGKPKGSKSATAELRNIGEELRGDNSNLIAVCNIVWEKALEGSQWAIEVIFNRLDGKPRLTELRENSEAPSGFSVSVIGSDGQVLDDCPSCRRAKAKESKN